MARSVFSHLQDSRAPPHVTVPWKHKNHHSKCPSLPPSSQAFGSASGVWCWVTQEQRDHCDTVGHMEPNIHCDTTEPHRTPIVGTQEIPLAALDGLRPLQGAQKPWHRAQDPCAFDFTPGKNYHLA